MKPCLPAFPQIKNAVMLSACFIGCCLLQPAAGEGLSLAQIIKQHSLPFEISGRLEMSITGRGQTTSALAWVFSRQQAEEFLCLYTTPEARRGFSLLKKPEGVYLYYPLQNAFVRLSKTEERNPLLPFGYAILDKSFLADYTVQTPRTGAGAQNDTPHLILVHTGAAAYPEIRLWLDEVAMVIKKEVYYDHTGMAVAAVIYQEYTSIDDVYIPLSWEIISYRAEKPHLRAGLSEVHKTLLPEYIFTRAYLEFICGN